jgi:hypothetical protein
MKYETMGGDIRDTGQALTTLKELNREDVFTNKAGKGRWRVLAQSCIFNRTAGSSTRACLNLETGKQEQKLCRIEVRKIEDKK